MDIIVTDLTRMHGDHVCLAGLDIETGACIRPLQYMGPQHHGRYLNYGEVRNADIKPGTILRAEFHPLQGARRPHTEDHLYSGEMQVVGNATPRQFQAALLRSSTSSVEEAFGQAPTGKHYSVETPPGISLVTIHVTSHSGRVSFSPNDFDPGKFKFHLVDGRRRDMSFLPINDLGIIDNMGAILQQDPRLRLVTQFYSQQTDIFVRLGLGREYRPPNQPLGNWIQMNGIYSFPDQRSSLRAYD